MTYGGKPCARHRKHIFVVCLHHEDSISFQSILSRAFCHFSSRWYPVQRKDRRTVTPFKSPLDRWSFRSFLLWDVNPWLGHLGPHILLQTAPLHQFGVPLKAFTKPQVSAIFHTFESIKSLQLKLPSFPWNIALWSIIFRWGRFGFRPLLCFIKPIWGILGFSLTKLVKGVQLFFLSIWALFVSFYVGSHPT